MKKLLTLIGVGVLACVVARAADSPPVDVDAGKNIYTGKCAKCHKLRDPNNYDVAAWDKWMGKMKKKAKLADDQYAQLAAYIKTIRTTK